MKVECMARRVQPTVLGQGAPVAPHNIHIRVVALFKTLKAPGKEERLRAGLKKSLILQNPLAFNSFLPTGLGRTA